MDCHNFHWIWYFIGIWCVPRLTIAIALSIHGKSLNLPLWAMIFIWIFALYPRDGFIRRKSNG